MLTFYTKPYKSPISGEVKYYPHLISPQPLSLNEIAQTISNQCTVTIHDTKAVLSALEEQIYVALRNGQSVRLGDLGSFRPSVKGKGKPLAKDVNVSCIVGVRVRFCPSAKMRANISLSSESVKFFHTTPPVKNVPESPSDPGGSHGGDVSPETGKGGSEI